MKPLLFAHRGDTKNHSENTMEAFRSAFAQGADGVECDLQENENGELILVHNYLYDKTITYTSFTDFLLEFKDKGRLEIELKTISVSFVEKVAAILKEYKPKDLEITSSIQPLLPHVKRLLPDVKIGLIFKQTLIENWMTEDFKLKYILSFLEIINANVLHLNLDNYFPKLTTTLNKKGYILHTHLYDNNPVKLQKVIDLGIDQCTIDDLNLLKTKNSFQY